MKHLIIGLGNIGPGYELTRHNMGFQVTDYLVKQHAVAFQPDRLAFFASFRYQGRSICVIKPTTYMNHSGKAVRYWLEKLRLSVEHSLVVVDDVALPFGKLRMRAQGSSAGHNGLKSIEAHLGTQAYPRLRLGIGNDFASGQQAAHVLSPFHAPELAKLPELIKQACEMILAFCIVGVGKTMERYN
ncbi:MAG: aminoacyl-tRNA hydrolase [Bacteroidota bacterium]